jgi:hypothetical protein
MNAKYPVAFSIYRLILEVQSASQFIWSSFLFADDGGAVLTFEGQPRQMNGAIQFPFRAV